MYLKFNQQKQNSIFQITDEKEVFKESRVKGNELISIIWNKQDTEIEFKIDGRPLLLGPNQIITSTYLQEVTFDRPHTPVIFSFNRAFYCIQDHDEEVSCNGIIFFGTQETPIITLSKDDQTSFEMLYQVFIEEFKTKDNIQGQMLQMLLKRLIIKCTRLAKEQLVPRALTSNQVDIIRKFNVLVDVHFKNKHHVVDYADLLNKSPKTLSNLFAIYGQKTPLQIIHNRIILEARRLLTYTDQNTKEIAYTLGFEEVSTFNKMFKKITHQTPTDFRKSSVLVH